MTSASKTNRNHILGVDIGGSFIKAAIVDISDGSLQTEIMKEETPAPAGPTQVRETIAKIVAAKQWSGDIGIGYPGVVKDGICLSAANVAEEWIQTDIRELFGDLTSGTVAVINDADAAGLAEMALGAGREENHKDGRVVLMLTLGTGIGSAFFYRGQLFPNTEFGHVEVDGLEAEDLAAASVRVDQKLDWAEWGKRVNRVLAEMDKLISPDVVILGGGVSENWSEYERYLQVVGDLRVAEMGNTAGLVGAALATRTSI